MSMKLIRKILFGAALVLSCNVVKAQEGAYSSYSPYSIFGVGDLTRQGTAYSRSMGGIGIATRNNRHINVVNPAAVAARDTLSFMLDFGVTADGRLYSQGDVKSAKNLFNISDFVFTVPIYRKSAFMAGITPFSSVGYDFSHDITDPKVLATTGNMNYRSYGEGDIYQVFAGAGATFWNKLSVGAQMIYYFGNIDKTTTMDFASSSYRDIYSGYILNLNAFGGKFGVQYDQALAPGLFLTVGATYRTSARLKGYVTDYKYATISSKSDTLKYNTDTLSRGRASKIASEYGIGVALRRGDKWRLEFDYTRSDWSKSNLDNAVGFANKGESTFSTTFSQSFKAGFEIVPNRNDIRYYMRRCSYRIGAYYDRDYYKLNGHTVNSYGLTFGMTLPVFRWYNGISIGVDLGQRGTKDNNMIRERYAMLVVGFNIHDIWFQKPKYE